MASEAWRLRPPFRLLTRDRKPPDDLPGASSVGDLTSVVLRRSRALAEPLRGTGGGVPGDLAPLSVRLTEMLSGSLPYSEKNGFRSLVYEMLVEGPALSGDLREW